MNKYKYILITLWVFSFSNLLSQGLYKDWEAIKNRDYPQWFLDAKLGIFIHWGVYSVPAWTGREGYSEWFLRGLQQKRKSTVDFQNRVFGSNFKYRDYANLFKAELFDPDEWADLFKKAGAKYIVFVSKHHDGYCLWDSKYSNGWNSVATGPKRDLVKDLKGAIEKTDLKFGLYYSLTEWNNKLHRWYNDDDKNIGNYVDKYMVPQFKELVAKFKPSLIFADGEWRNSAKQLRSKELISWYYNLVGEEAIVNDRWGRGIKIGFLTPEYTPGLKNIDRPWAEVRSTSRSFAWNRNEPLEDYMSLKELVHFFASAVSNGGGIILNVGPRADGKIPLIQQERLLGLGKWLAKNGEAIYGSSKWEYRQGDFSKVNFTKIDPNINFDWIRNKPSYPLAEDYFTIMWESNLTAPYSGDFDFVIDLADDDEAKLFLDDILVYSSKGDKVDYKKNINLEKGKKYKLRLDYKENKVNAKVKLYWKYDGKEKQIIPSKYFSLDKDKKGLRGTYESDFQSMAYTKKGNDIYIIIFKWPYKDKKLNIDFPIKPKTPIQVSLLGYGGSIEYEHKDDRLKIYLEDIDMTNIYDEPAWVFKVKNAL